MIPSVRRMVSVRQPSDVDLGESPSQSTHTRTRTCAYTHTHTNAHIHSDVNICGDSSSRRRPRSEPHLLPDLPHTHAWINLFYPGPKPNLAQSFIVSHKYKYIDANKYAQIHTEKHTHARTHKLTTKEQPAHDSSRRQSVMAGWSCADSVSTPET